MRDDEAARYYETVWRTNHSFYSAAFGLARQRARAGDRAGAIATLDQITPASAHFTAAGTTAIEILLDGRTADDAGRTDAARCRQARLGADPGVGDQASDDPAEGARRRAGVAARREIRPRLRGCSVPTSTSTASGSEWSTATARWRTRRPTCGSASTWWRRQMRSGRGPDYERRGGDVPAMRRDRRARRPVL